METAEYICELCGKSFDSQAKLNGHHMTCKRKHEPNKPETPEKEKVKPLTPEEQALAQRIATADKDWERDVIREDMLNDFSLAHNPLDLPPECRQRQDRREYAYRWAEAKPRRIDELRNSPGPMRWEIVNKTTAPYLPDKMFDPIHGGVQVLDQILMYKPWKAHETVQKRKQELAEIQDGSGDLKRRHGEKRDGIEYYAGENYKIGGADEVITDALGREEIDLDEPDGGAFTDLEVAE